MDVNGFALIFGAGSGIGLETALTFAERGAAGVAFADSNLRAAEEASAKIKGPTTVENYQTLALEVDVADRASVRSMMEQVQRKFGRIDYAVNSAGISPGRSTYLDTIDEDMFDREEIKVMIAQEPTYVEGRSSRRSVGPGAIVNITSLPALIGPARAVTYTASKSAARGIIKCAALDNCSSGLRINELCPGYTNTPLARAVYQNSPGMEESINKVMPLGRIANVEEIAGIAHSLVGPAAGFINGHPMVVDSGVSM